MRIIETNTNNRSGYQKAARGAQMIKGAAKAGSGVASGNFVAVAQGVAEAISPKVILAIAAIILFFALLPVIVISSIPQMLFSWGTVNDAELIARNRHGTELAQYYEDTIAEQPEGVNPDIYWLISIESVRKKQNLDEISKRDVKASVENSYTIDDETDEVYNKTPEEIMNELGFDEEQKNWANLMYDTLNYQYLDPNSGFGDEGGLPSYDGVMLGESGETQVVYYNQLDSRWSNQMYGRSSTIGAAGCGPTALAICVSTLTGNSVDPPAVCDWSVKNGHRCEGNGSYHSLIPEGAKHYGLNVEKLGRSNARELESHLSSGHLVIAIMAKGHFTSSGHFIVLRGITGNGKVLVADPASYRRSEQAWDMSIILNEARGTAAAGGPFWCLSK